MNDVLFNLKANYSKEAVCYQMLVTELGNQHTQALLLLRDYDMYP